MEEIGTTGTDNLPIYAVKLSYNANQELDKPKVLILGQCPRRNFRCRGIDGNDP